MVFDKENGENGRPLEQLTKDNMRVILLDIDRSLLEDNDSPEIVTQKVDVLNQFLAELAFQSGVNLIPVILTQRPWSVFYGKDALPKFSPLLEINQQRHAATGEVVSVSPFIVLAEFGGVALMPDRQRGWRMEKNPDLKNIGLEERVDELTGWFTKMNLIPEPGRTYTGPIGDQHLETTWLEPGNVFYLALQEKNGEPMETRKKEALANIFKELLKENHEFGILKAFSIVISGRDLDFLPRIYENDGKLLGADWLRRLLLPEHSWFSFGNLIAVDDQSHVAGPLFEKVLAGGGYTIAVANADEGLKRICLGQKNGIVSPHPYLPGVLDGLMKTINCVLE